MCFCFLYIGFRMDGSSCIVALSIALLSFYVGTTGSDPSTCKITEIKCLNGSCIQLSKYCNGNYDCHDKSDEPKSCSGKENIHVAPVFIKLYQTFPYEFILYTSSLPSIISYTAPHHIHRRLTTGFAIDWHSKKYSSIRNKNKTQKNVKKKF